MVFLVPLILALPFINRAYFVDDHYFVEMAEWLKVHPGLPYHFRADDAGLQNRGWEENGMVRMVNPPVHQYFLAFLLKLGGEKEWFLRLGCVMLSCFSGLFIFGLARRWTKYPLLSTLLVLATPAFWLSSYSLLIDSTAGFFFLGALLFFVKGSEEDSRFPARREWLFIILSGVFMGLAVLTKYPALLIVPVTFLWWLFNFKSLRRPWIFFVAWGISFLFLLGFSLYTAHVYGEPHILAASRRMMVSGNVAKLAFFVFFAGATIVPVVAWWVNGIWINLLLAGGGVGIAGFLASRFGGFSVWQAGLFAFWTCSSFAFFVALLVFYFKWGWIYPRDHFLVGWILGFVLMMSYVMPWVAARYYLIALPAIVFLGARFIECRWGKNARKIMAGLLAGMVVLGAGLAYADYQQAETNRRLVGDLKSRGFSGGPGHYYLGDSFTMSYMKNEGWTPCFPDTQFRVGDLVLGRSVTMPLVWFKKCPIEVKIVKAFDYPTWFPVKVMDYHGSAGFYASVWGVLPFTFSSVPWERYYLVEVTRVLRISPNSATMPVS